MGFKAFMIFAAVARRVAHVEGLLDTPIEPVDHHSIRIDIRRARDLFFIHSESTGSDVMALDELDIELKAASFDEKRRVSWNMPAVCLASLH